MIDIKIILIVILSYCHNCHNCHNCHIWILLIEYQCFKCESHYDFYISQCIEYIVVEISLYFTLLLLKSTLELLEKTGVDFTHTMMICVHKSTLWCLANYSKGVADSVVWFGGAFRVKCSVAQYRSISFNIAHYFENQPKINAELFVRSEEML